MNRLANFIISRTITRPPNQVIGGVDDPYLLRWHVIPRNPLFNIYLHLFLRSDDPRALHDHPWANISWLMLGTYTEHVLANGKPATRIRYAGDVVIRPSGRSLHRIELHSGSVWTLFITGPRYRKWGFQCPQGWVRNDLYNDSNDPGVIGKGCAQ